MVFDLPRGERPCSRRLPAIHIAAARKSRNAV